jgi:FAD/FMN-containing dehydrogenase
VSGVSRRAFVQGGVAAAIGLSAGVGSGLLWKPRRITAQEGVDPAAIADLRSRLNGTVILPGDSGYPTASAPANGRFLNVLPAAVARCADEADVVTCIKWCNENGVAPVARGGGHSYAGYCTTTGLLIDLRRLNSVEIDRHKGTMVTGGAATNGDYFVAFENGPLFLPGGTCLGVGVGGLVLGGGIGYNTHWAGLTCDHLLASRIVTAAGEVLEIDETTNNDLFWACCGGAGGNFGINTSFTFKLVEAPQANVGWYLFRWRGADAAEDVFTAFHKILANAPAALNAVAMAQATPIAGGGPRAAIDVMSRGQYIGPLDELRDLVQPLLAIKPQEQTLEERTFWAVQRYIATAEPAPHSFGDISRYAAEPLPDSTVATLVDLLAACPSRSADANGSIWSLGWVGGEVMNGVSRTETAYVHRGMMTLLRPTTVWPNDAPASVSDGLNQWTDEVINTITPFTPEESYQNFPNRSLTNWSQLYYAENFERLVDVKTKYDPKNLFNHPQSIPSRG